MDASAYYPGSFTFATSLLDLQGNSLITQLRVV
ncbi:BgTH12-00026 [Blumeria graminis f. sp. triticale]|uniref:BgTH12-00026 n=1 Tax=Blumeria graminis f. sp. triticale TaxID=1689686 RepID=A0A9W4GGZ5_BLUGR|nr:BgTH12-00026 [Blumeria graminis f. sp. triticale]